MRLRLFRAPTMTDAMAQLRAALGPDAVILSSRRTAGGVEVTAALESAEPVLILPDAPLASAAPDPLGWHNLPPELAGRLRGGSLHDRLGEALPFAALPDGDRPLLLVGPPGAGKTATCAKLATRAVLAGGAPLVITTDGERAGAVEQLAAFTRVLGVTLAVAATAGTLLKALSRRASGQGVLIDSAGLDPFAADQAAALQEFVMVADAAVVLVLPAGLDAGEAGDLASAFREQGAQHLLPTRCDIARRLGGVLAAAAAGPALTEAGTGPGAADGLTPITPAWLAARLLADPQEARR